MPDVAVVVGDIRLEARFEDKAAPRTCEALGRMLPLHSKIVHVRWSGEAMWVPMGEMALDLPPENATSYPSPGQILLYPGGISETEILIPYGPTHFASKAGPFRTGSLTAPGSGLLSLACTMAKRNPSPPVPPQSRDLLAV